MRQKLGVVVITLLIIIFSSILLLKHQRELGNNCTDDAYISFRYAENLARGKGLVYNIGERVEGFSNPLWTFTLAISAMLGYNLESASRHLGQLFALVALTFSLLLAMRLSNSQFIAPFATALMLTGSTGFVLYSTAGLETAQYSFILVLTAFLTTFRHPILRALALIFGFLAALSRPEGVLVSISLWLVAILWILKAKKLERIIIGIGMVLSIVGFAAYLLFRYQYFGDIYPNTYYAKPVNWLAGADSISDLRKNMLNANTGFHGGLILAMLIISATAVNLSYGWIISSAIVTSGLIFLYYAGIDWMPFARFFAPYHTVFCAASIASLFVLIDRSPLYTSLSPLDLNSKVETFLLRNKIICSLLALMVGFLSQVFFDLDARKFISRGSKLPYHVVSGHFVRYVASELNKILSDVEPYSVSIVTKRIGAIGYFCPVRIEDLYGLVDKSVALIFHKYRNSKNTSARDKEVATLILNRNPEMVLIFSEKPFKNPSDPYQNKDMNKLESIQRQALKEALARGYYFAKKFHKGDLSAYLYLRSDFNL